MSSAATGVPPRATNHTALIVSDKALKLLDTRIKRIKKDILPDSPYIISAEGSLPSNYVRNTHPNNCNGWRKYTNFADNERQLQYLSFKDRSKDMSVRGMHARGGWDDGKGGIDLGGGKTSLTSSDAATPYTIQGPKKKITLADYRNKDRSKVAPGQGTKPPVSELREVAKTVEKRAEQPTKAPDPTSSQVSEQHGRKRSADTMAAINESQALEAPLDVRPTKKARTTPEIDTAAAKNLPKSTSSKPTQAAVQSDVKNDVKIDSLKVPSSKVHHEGKSPQLEAPSLKVKLKVSKTENAAPHGLPTMLSPLSLPSDIEADIEEELARRTRTPTPSNRGDASSAEKPKASKDSLNGTPSSSEKHAAPKIVQKTTPKNAFTSTKGPQELKGVTSAPRQGNKDSELDKAVPAKPIANGVSKPSTPIVKGAVPEAPRKLRLRITLVIKKKSNRKRLGEYLRLKPTPGKYPSGMHREDSTESKQKDDIGNRRRTESLASKASEKRRRQDDEDDLEPEPPIKRQRAPLGLAHKTHTPKQSSISSPALSHLGSAQKTHLSTPDVGFTSTPMMRAGSGGSSVHTPHQLATNWTPVAPDTGHSRTSTNTLSASKPKSVDLATEAKRLTRIGADLKHDADKFFKSKGGMSDTERKQGVIFGIESVLCFMLSFTLNEVCLQNGDRVSWKSILPFLAKVNEEAQGFKHLAGLAILIESVIREILVHIDMQRLNRNPLDDYFNNSEPADTTKTKEQIKAAEYGRQYNELRRNTDRAQALLRSSWDFLGLKEISTKFPDTWAKREDVRPPIGKGPEIIKAGDYKRTFTLPVSSMTTKLEAVNFVASILAEFCQNENMDFAPKLVL